MKRAFTMIELIFVIVILGILVAVALPRLAATRDDAEIVTKAENIKQAIVDLAAYYTSQGQFAQTLSAMTNVTTPVSIRGKNCAVFTLDNSTKVTLTKSYEGLCMDVWNVGGLDNLQNVIPIMKSINTSENDGIIVIEPAKSTN